MSTDPIIFNLKPIPNTDNRFKALKLWMSDSIPRQSWKVRYNRVLAGWNRRLGRENVILIVTAVTITGDTEAMLFKLGWSDLLVGE